MITQLSFLSELFLFKWQKCLTHSHHNSLTHSHQLKCHYACHPLFLEDIEAIHRLASPKSACRLLRSGCLSDVLCGFGIVRGPRYS